MTGLSVEHLAKDYGGPPVLVDVNLTLPGGSLTALLGPSGSGKTTLLRVVAGFEPADRGTVTVGQEVVDDGRRFVAPERRHIGYVPQEGALFPHLTVAKNVAFGLPRGRRRAGAIEELLALVGMEGLGGRYPHELSGGQQQRVALARALAVEPSVVLLDEPFASLDATLRASVRTDVQRVLRLAGTTALLVTHDQSEALSWADQVAVLQEGRIGQLDRPEAVYARPADAELARFVGEANLVEGSLGDPDNGASGPREALVRTVFGPLPLSRPMTGRPGAPVTVLVRPEQLRLADADSRTGLGGPALACTVAGYEYYGHDAVVRLLPEAGSGVGAGGLIVRTTGARARQLGERVTVTATGPVVAWAQRAGEDEPPEG